MTDPERRDVQYLLDALKRAEWSDIRDETAKCPVCRRPKAWGHVCSCILGLATRKVGPRLMGTESLAPSENEITLANISDPENLKALAWRVRNCVPAVNPKSVVRIPAEQTMAELSDISDALFKLEELMR